MPFLIKLSIFTTSLHSCFIWNNEAVNTVNRGNRSANSKKYSSKTSAIEICHIFAIDIHWLHCRIKHQELQDRVTRTSLAQYMSLVTCQIFSYSQKLEYMEKLGPGNNFSKFGGMYFNAALVFHLGRLYHSGWGKLFWLLDAEEKSTNCSQSRWV